MNIRPPLLFPQGKAFIRLILFSFLALALCSCVTGKKGGSDDGAPSSRPSGSSANPNEKSLAYGISLTVPASYAITGLIGPEDATKASLDSRRQAGERVLLLESAGPPSVRGIEPLMGVFLVNQEGTFMPREFAEKMKPEEFAALSKDMLEREKAEAKKKKAPSGLMNIQVSRDTINGKLAIKQQMQVKGPDGRPVYLTHWDVYLPNGAGVAFKSVYDQDVPGLETEISNIVRSLKVM